jgi:hypothetical protein
MLYFTNVQGLNIMRALSLRMPICLISLFALDSATATYLDDVCVDDIRQLKSELIVYAYDQTSVDRHFLLVISTS